MELSLSELEQLTGKTYRTIRKRIKRLKPIREEGSKIIYDSAESLELIYHKESDGELSLDQERAKLAHIQTKKLELEYKKLDGTLVDAKEVVEAYSKRILAARAKFLKIPVRLAAIFKAIETPDELQAEAKTLVWEALDEVANVECKSPNA